MVFRKNKKPLETVNEETESPADDDKISDLPAENADPAADAIKYPEDVKNRDTENSSEF